MPPYQPVRRGEQISFIVWNIVFLILYLAEAMTARLKMLKSFTDVFSYLSLTLLILNIFIHTQT